MPAKLHPTSSKSLWWFKSNLTLKSIGWLIGLAWIPALILASTIFAAYRFTQVERARTQVKNTTIGLALQLSAVVLDRQSYLLEISNTELLKSFLQNLGNEGSYPNSLVNNLDTFLIQQAVSNPDILYLALLNPAGEVIAEFSQSPFFQRLDVPSILRFSNSPNFSKFEYGLTESTKNRLVLLSFRQVGLAVNHSNYSLLEINSIPLVNSFLASTPGLTQGSTAALFLDGDTYLTKSENTSGLTQINRQAHQPPWLETLRNNPNPAGTDLPDYYPKHFTYAHNIPGLPAALLLSNPRSVSIGLNTSMILLLGLAFLRGC